MFVTSHKISANNTQPHYYSPLSAGLPGGPPGTGPPHYHALPPNHLHQPPMQHPLHSPSPPNSNYHKDERTQRQHTKLLRKLDQKHREISEFTIHQRLEYPEIYCFRFQKVQRLKVNHRQRHCTGESPKQTACTSAAKFQRLLTEASQWQRRPTRRPVALPPTKMVTAVHQLPMTKMKCRPSLSSCHPFSPHKFLK